MKHDKPTVAIVQVIESTGYVGTIHTLLPGDSSTQLNDFRTRCVPIELTDELYVFFKSLRSEGGMNRHFREWLSRFFTAGYKGLEIPKIPLKFVFGQTRADWCALCKDVYARGMGKADEHDRKTA